jgi:hypothetical protein
MDPAVLQRQHSAPRYPGVVPRDVAVLVSAPAARGTGGRWIRRRGRHDRLVPQAVGVIRIPQIGRHKITANVVKAGPIETQEHVRRGTLCEHGSHRGRGWDPRTVRFSSVGSRVLAEAGPLARDSGMHGRGFVTQRMRPSKPRPPSARQLRLRRMRECEAARRQHRLERAMLDDHERSEEDRGADQLTEHAGARPAVLVCAEWSEHEQEWAAVSVDCSSGSTRRAARSEDSPGRIRATWPRATAESC